jgi:hypothetical protein
MAGKIDYKRELKHLYSASAKVPSIVQVPAMHFLMIDGRGAPSTLEGLWWVDDLRDLDRRELWQWTMMIMQPDCVAGALVTETIADVVKKSTAKKKALPGLARLRYKFFAEGEAAQILHTGPYADEKPTIDKLHAFIHDAGYQLRAKHHELYLGDPRRTAPAKLKTILRQPVEKA